MKWKNLAKRIILPASVATLIFGLIHLYKSACKEIYRGKINDTEIVYVEKPFSNTMHVFDGNAVYILIDSAGRKQNFGHPNSALEQNFGNQELDKIMVQNEGKREVFFNSEFSDKSNLPRQQYKKQLFEKANNFYNSTREQIRAKIEEEYEKSMPKFLQ